MFVRIISGCALTIVLLQVAFRADAQATDSKADGNTKPTGIVVATVNGEPIRKEIVDRSLEALVRGQKVDPAFLPKLQAAALKQTIEGHLVNKVLIGQKNAVTPSDINKAKSEILRAQNTTFETFLTRNNITEQDFLGWLVGQLMVGKYVAANSSEEGLQAFFKDNKHLYDGTIRRVSHVVLRPDGPTNERVINGLVEKAKQLRSEIQSGQIKFEDAAAKYSAGPSRRNGGDLGYVPLTGVMAPSFTKVAYEIQPNEVSEPVPTSSGIHLIKVTEIKAGTKTLDEVKPVVQQAYAQYIMEKLKEDEFKKANIEYAGNFPYFKPGTNEVVMPGQAPDSPTK